MVGDGYSIEYEEEGRGDIVIHPVGVLANVVWCR
jgi:hypothetical protein